MTTVSTPAAEGGAARHAGKFLTFFLAGEEYGLEILKVQEIIGILPITRVPRAPRHIRGVVNLRGKVIPIVDLRVVFGMTEDAAEETCIIVVQVRGVQLGIVVDRVSEVSMVTAAEIDEPPSFGAGVRTDFILGIGKSQSRVRMLLDIERALSANELAELQSAVG
ncbi:MAG: purine-binding chemotaxis protein CheW [Gemmatimonadetes bacterium]|nr:purine-binding chemotaxis protein CheW [Gemmatimonadota bacterium]